MICTIRLLKIQTKKGKMCLNWLVCKLRQQKRKKEWFSQHVFVGIDIEDRNHHIVWMFAGFRTCLKVSVFTGISYSIVRIQLSGCPFWPVILYCYTNVMFCSGLIQWPSLGCISCYTMLCNIQIPFSGLSFWCIVTLQNVMYCLDPTQWPCSMMYCCSLQYIVLYCPDQSRHLTNTSVSSPLKLIMLILKIYMFRVSLTGSAPRNPMHSMSAY